MCRFIGSEINVKHHVESAICRRSSVQPSGISTKCRPCNHSTKAELVYQSKALSPFLSIHTKLRYTNPNPSILSAQKVLRAAQILKIPTYVTTQNGAKLGSTVSELTDLIAGAEVNADKTAFSMLRVPALETHFPAVLPPENKEQRQVAIVGIESHICVTQTSLDLLARGHKVYVLADGVSSCNPEEIPIALDRLRAEGVTVTTTESWLYECMGDAAIPEFRDVAKLVKETSEGSKTVMRSLLSRI